MSNLKDNTSSPEPNFERITPKDNVFLINAISSNIGKLTTSSLANYNFDKESLADFLRML